MAKVCIICTEEVKGGHAVSDDFVIKAIRGAKQSLKVAKNNELMVCPKCVPEYIKKREGYERKLAMYIILAGFIFILLAILPVVTGGFSIQSFIIALFMGGLLIALPVMTSHVPKCDGALSQKGAFAKKPTLPFLGKKDEGNVASSKKGKEGAKRR